MAKAIIASGGSGGAGSDDTTAEAGDVLKGKTYIGSDTDDEVGTGTLELTGNAGTGDVVSGKTFYTTNPKSKQTGTLADKNGTTQLATASLDNSNSRLQMTIPETGRYNTSSKLYAAFSSIANLIGLTAAKLANGQKVLGLTGTYKGLGNASQGQVLAGKTFSTASLSNATGTMPDHTAKPSKIQNRRIANDRFEVAVDAGYYKCLWADGSYEYMELSEVASTAGLTAGKLWPGNTVLGITSNKSTMAGKTITPSTSQQTVSCNGKAMTGNIVVNAIPSSYINTGNWTVFNSGTFSSGFGLVPNLVKYNEVVQPNTAGTGGTIRYSEETVTVPAQSMSKTSTPLGDNYRDGAIVVDGNSTFGSRLFESGKTSYQTVYHYPNQMVLFSRAIDLSKFSSIKVTVSIAQGNTEVTAYMHFCPSNKKAFGVSEFIGIYNNKTGTFTKTIDVSDMSGQYFFGFSGYTRYNNYWLKISKIELVA